MIGGDHSVNYGHFCAISDHLDTDDLCLVYIDAHMDIHTPETSKAQASGAPHGTNVRALWGDGDARWMTIPRRRRVLKPENLFYIATRSFEPAEIEHVTENNINISFCKNCWARYTCAGECFSVGYMNHGIFEKPSSTMCELKKYLIQLSIYFWTCLKYEHQDLYNECLEKY